MSRGNADGMTPFCLEPPLTVLFPLHVPGQGCAWPCLWVLLLTCSPFTGRLHNSLRQFRFQCHCQQFTQDGYIWRWRIWNYLDPCCVCSEQGFQRTFLFFFFFKDPFSAIHKSQVALRLPFQIIAFLKLHERIQYIHLLGQVPATCSKLIWFCFLPDLQWSVKEGINYGGSSILNYIILIFFFFCRMGHHIITNSYRVCMQFKFPK